MIGLDNATWSMIEPFLVDGSMPNLASTLDRGLRADLWSPGAFIAESRWPEFATGRASREMAYWSMMEFDPVTYRSYYGRTPNVTSFWARPDLTSIVFDVPEVGLSEDVRGLQVVGWGSHAQGHPICSSPHDLVGRIDRRFGVHPMTLSDSHNAMHNPAYMANLTEAMVDGVHLRTRVAQWLLEQRPDWDLFITVFGEPHVLGHQYLHALTEGHPLESVIDMATTRDQIRRVVCELDRAFGDLVAAFDDDVALMVFVTHGMRANSVDTVGGTLIPELLHRQHFGEPLLDLPRWDPSGAPVVPDPRSLPRHWLEAHLRRPVPSTSRGLTQLRKKAAHRVRHHLSPRAIADLERIAWRRPRFWEMRRRPPAPLETTDPLAEAARHESEQMAAAAWYRDRWPEMRYFVVPSFSDCHIRVNLAGRERHGIVPRAHYDAVLDEITDDLRSLTDARTGQPVVAEVLRVRENPTEEPGPPCDLVVVMSEVVTDVVEHPTQGRIGPVPFRRVGEHSGHGWCVVADGEHRGRVEGTFRPRDLAATALDLLEIPADPRVTGRSILAAPSRTETAADE